MKYSELLKSLTLDQKADLVNDMRDWVKDCQWGDIEEEDVDNMSDEELIRGVNANYSGGINEFVRTFLEDSKQFIR